MEIRPGVSVDDSALATFVERHGIRRLAAFGSVLRADLPLLQGRRTPVR